MTVKMPKRVKLLSFNFKLNLIVYAAVLFLSVITATVIFVRAKKTPGFYSLTAVYCCLILWTVLYVNEYLFSSNEAQMYFNVRLTLVPTMFIGALFLIFAFYYAGIIKPGNRMKIISLVLLPELLCVWPLFTNKYFYLVLISKKFGGNEDVWGILMFVSEVITYLYVIAAVVIIAKKLRSRGTSNVSLFVVAVAVPMLIQVLQFTIKPLSDLGIYLTPPGFAVFSVVCTVYVLKHRLIEIVPEASHQLFTILNEAVFILDADGRIMEANDAAGLYLKDVLEYKPYMNFTTVIDALARYSDDNSKLTKLKSRVGEHGGGSYEDVLALRLPPSGNRQYAVRISPIYTNGKKLIGKLVVVNDMTEYRNQTLVSERNRVSDRLHDSLGNSINVISSNLEYVMNNFADTDEVRECLRVSHDRAVGAFVQLRRIVEELTPIDIEQRGLLRALDTLFYRLRVKGLYVDFSHNIRDDSLLSQS